MTEKMFNKYRNENYSQIYYNSKFKLIKGDKIVENKEKILKKNDEDYSNNDEEDSLSESFFDFYSKKENIKENFD